jgi:hypothetical protein
MNTLSRLSGGGRRPQLLKPRPATLFHLGQTFRSPRGFVETTFRFFRSMLKPFQQLRLKGDPREVPPASIITDCLDSLCRHRFPVSSGREGIRRQKIRRQPIS